MILKTVFVGLSAALMSLFACAASAPDFQVHYERYHNGQFDTDAAFIDITAVGPNQYQVSGTAISVADASAGLVNVGEINGVVTVTGHQLHYDVDGCTLHLLLDQNTLVVSHDNGCGGLNVSFNGTYVKTSERQ
ncbi:hypothetical protein CKA27_17655 [Vibrio coralliilyticus]|nr:hypothetical protein CKA27_17655 [Vibrio coralliilyticus]